VGSIRNHIFWLLIAVFSLVPRLYYLGKDFYSIDSDRWFRRAVDFQHNLLNGNFAGTYQKQHPGVTTMWLGGTSYKILTVIYPKITGHILDENIPADFITINFSIKLSQVLATLGLAFLSYWLTQKIFDRTVAYIYLLLILIDPFFLFYTRQFHVDVLMSSFGFIGGLYSLLYLQQTRLNRVPPDSGGTRIHIVLSAFFCGLAFLSKSPALAIAGSCGLAILASNIIHKDYKKAIIHSTIFSLIFLATYLIVFPANWVNPIEVTRQIIHDSIENTDKISSVYILNHADSNFGDKFYLLVFLFRFSPFLIAGIIFTIVKSLSKLVTNTMQKGRVPHFKGSSLINLLPFLGYLILLALLIEDRKLYERYLLPFVPVLTLFVSVNLAPLIKSKLTKPIILIPLILFAAYEIFVISPNFIVYPTLFATRDTQMKLFTELGGCESMLYDVATDINNLEGEDDDTYSIGISGTYKGCLKPYTVGVVDDMTEYIRRKSPLRDYPKYLVLFKTDDRWLKNLYIMNVYTPVKTYYISNTPVYYLFKKNI